jgi:K+-sensing histidine kinase KdpD
VSKRKRHSIFRKSLTRAIIFGVLVLFVASTFEPYNQSQLSLVLIYFIGVLSVTLLTGTRRFDGGWWLFSCLSHE